MQEKSKPFYVGKVFKHPSFVKTEEANPSLTVYTKEFVQYWKFGYSPLVGKDGILSVPNIYADNAIGRAHVEPIEKDPLTYSSSDEAWELWALGTSNSPPTSNSFLIYCVSETRNSCILAYLDQSEEDSHKILNDMAFRKRMRNRAEEFYQSQKALPMPKDEHDEIFGEKWVIREE